MGSNQEIGNRITPERTFIVILIITALLTAMLFVSIIITVKSFDLLSDETNSYIELQEAADSLMKASNYLTDEAQCYTVLGKREHMENYFTEAEETRRREQAVEAMENTLPESHALREIKDAMSDSLALMDREYYAMKLVLLAQDDGKIPKAMKEVAVSEEDLSLSPEGKMDLARTMMHDSKYYDQKNQIRAHMVQCIEELKIETREAQFSVQMDVRKALMAMTTMILAEAVSVVLLLWASSKLDTTKRRR